MNLTLELDKPIHIPNEELVQLCSHSEFIRVLLCEMLYCSIHTKCEYCFSRTFEGGHTVHIDRNLITIEIPNVPKHTKRHYVKTIDNIADLLCAANECSDEETCGSCKVNSNGEIKCIVREMHE